MLVPKSDTGLPLHYPGRRKQPPRAIKTEHPLSQISHSFYPGAQIQQHVVPTDLTTLLSMLDAPRPEGQRYIVTSKQCTRTPSGKDHYHTTVLDEASGVFYRAGHLTGIMSLLKGVARRRGPAVLLLRGSERYTGPAAASEA